MKKVLIIGANGKVGRIVADKMKKSADFDPLALFRTEEQKDFFEQRDIGFRVASLEGSIGQLEEAMAGMDAVVFSAGSGAKTGDDKTLTVDLDGAVKSMEAALNAGVTRYIMVSGLNADDRKAWETSGLKPYYIAKHYADRLLRSMGLDYSIIRPGLLLDQQGTGKITTEDPASGEGVPREDVAELILELLRSDNGIGKVIEFNGGETPIEDVVKGL